MASVSGEAPASHGHTFSKKTFHKPTYCHHCTDMLWGLIQQGYICEVCNFVVHDRCLKTVVSPCSSIAASLIKNPVAHCWSEQTHHKRKFCNVCRKRLEDSLSIHCEICEYFVHADCQDFAVADCKENATYVPGKELSNVHHQHHWREGNLPNNSKCAVCKKTCWSAECLAGMRCEWCGITSHAVCHKQISGECTFGNLEPIYLPPHAVSIPRTEVPMETIIGVGSGGRNVGIPPTSVSDDFSSGDITKHRDDDYPHARGKDKEKEDREEESIKVYDGNISYRRRIFRVVTVPRQSNVEQFLTAALRAFHITRDPENKFSCIGPIYYEYGSMVIIYEDADKAVRALYKLRESSYEDKHLLVMLLPNIEPSAVPAGVQPLLVFVNVKSGGCQGLELISSFRKLLNPYQVFDLDNGGPLPGLYVFRHIKDYKILVCGGDGTIGWVLQCLDNVGQDSECSSPACAIVPLGTAGSTNEDNTQIFVMNNYFGIGIDADLCLDFHNAREENPSKFISSWGSGANPWGPEKEDHFTKPNHWDGMLEVVGVTGVVHLGQIQSGLRSAMRIAQGGHIKIHLNSDVPVQVDGEPWVQSPGDVVVLKSALKVIFLLIMQR
ncbi:Diacylglycerol kinase 1 [Gryllus bimaculatus]|nr:Diacylglycerol kinase 1 [Gryllus bimaculatus]